MMTNGRSPRVVTATEDFETYRGLLFGIAYRMLGSVAEAEDIVQDAYLRYRSASPEEIRAPKAFLSTIVTRLCLNHLQSARVRRETYIGPWLPEPVLGTGVDEGLEGKEDSISMAFLVLLEKLAPVERAVLLLRDVFDYEYEAIAEIIGKSEAACRQIRSRAKKRLGGGRRFKPSAEAQRRAVEGFLRAALTGDVNGLMDLLTEDATLWGDGGGKARGATRVPISGRKKVAAFIVGTRNLVDQDATVVEMLDVNGEPGAILRERGRTIVVMTFEMAGDRIQALRFVANPDKLRHI